MTPSDSPEKDGNPILSLPGLVRRDGKVALKQIGNTQRPVPVPINGVEVQASIQHNIWLLWVEEEQVGKALQFKIKGCECNGGAYKPLFKPASVEDVSIFETGDRPR